MAINHEPRICGPCSECCKGTLSGVAHGIPFFKGRPCHYYLNGCSIYEQRPEKPCQVFQCGWLQDVKHIFPEWMRPDLSGVIMTWQQWRGEEVYLKVDESGSKIDSSVLNYLMQFHVAYGSPIAVQVDRSWYYYGPPEFLATMNNSITGFRP